MTAAAANSEEVGSAFIRLNISLEGDKKGVTLEMKPKEFFAMLHQLESARYALQGVSNNEGWISCRLFTYADLVDLEKAI